MIGERAAGVGKNEVGRSSYGLNTPADLALRHTHQPGSVNSAPSLVMPYTSNVRPLPPIRPEVCDPTGHRVERSRLVCAYTRST